VSAPPPPGPPAPGPPAPGPPAPVPSGADPLAPDVRAAVGAVTNARLFIPGGPSSYDTASWLALRADHAAARDAVRSELDLDLDGPGLGAWVAARGAVVVDSAAADGPTHLLRPDLGRRLSGASRRRLVAAVAAPVAAGGAEAGVDADGGEADLALVVADGLSAVAVDAHAAALADALLAGAAERGWHVRDPPVVVRRGRVGILNELGPILAARVVVLVIGERPGLAAADSLSAYLAHRPGPGATDADRNLVSGIRERGTPIPAAARRILDLAGLLLAAGRSGVEVKERLGPGPGGELAGPP
jgi:ethanolamine ammonia-lyase small subunit